MLRGDRQVFHPGVLSQLRPLFSIEFDGIELRGKLFVLLHRNLGAVHDPFADARNLLPLPGPRWNRIEAPMYEQTEFGLAEPFAAWVVHLARGIFGAGHRYVGTR